LNTIEANFGSNDKLETEPISLRVTANTNQCAADEQYKPLWPRFKQQGSTKIE
jgi:hypothetical protein